MMGILIFYQVYLNLGEKCRNRVLGNMFEIRDVSVADVLVRDNGIIFRLFSNGIFRQYFFRIVNDTGELFCSKKSVDRLGELSDYISDEEEKIIFLVGDLLRCRDEYWVYQQIRKFL